MANTGSDMGNFDFALSFRLNMQDAEREMRDMWQVLREMSSQSIALKLEADTDFKKARADLQELTRQTQLLIDKTKAAEAEQGKLADGIEQAMKTVDKHVAGAGRAIQEAFDSGELEGVRRKVEELKGSLQQVSNVMREVAGQQVKVIDGIVSPMQKMGGSKKLAGLGDGTRETYNALNELQRQKQELREVQNAYEALVRDIKTKYEGKKGAAGKLSRNDADALEELGNALSIAEMEVKSAEADLKDVREKYGKTVDEYEKVFKLMIQLGEEIEHTSTRLERLKTSGGSADDVQALERYMKWLNSFVIPEDAMRNMGELQKRLSVAGGANTKQLRTTMQSIAEGGAEAMFDAAVQGFVDALQEHKKSALSAAEANRIKEESMKRYGALHTQLTRTYVEAATHSLGPALAQGGNLRSLIDNVMGGLGIGGLAGARGALGDIDTTNLRPMQIKLDTDDFILQIGYAIEAAEKMFPMKLIGNVQELAKAQIAIQRASIREAKKEATTPTPSSTSRRRTKTADDRELEEGLLQIKRAEQMARRAAAQANPIDTLAAFGFDKNLLNNIMAARSGKPITAVQDAVAQRVNFTQSYADAMNKAGTNEERDSMRYAFEEFNKAFTDLERILRENNNREAQKAATKQRQDAAMNAYNQEVVQRMTSNMSAFRNVYQLFNDTPLDRYKDRMDAYRKVYADIRKYEHELIGYTHARSQDEVRIADTRINAARRAVEIAQDELNIRMLAGGPNVNMRRLDSQFRINNSGQLYNRVDFARQGGQFVREDMGPIRAYKQISELLTQEFGPALEAYNRSLREARKELLADAREAENQFDTKRARELYRKAEGISEVNRDDFISMAYGRSGNASSQAGIREMFRANMSLSDRENMLMARGRKYGKEQEYSEAIMRRRLKTLTEELAVWDKLDDKIRAARREMEILQRYDALQGNKNQDPFGLRQAARGMSHAMGGWAIGLSAGFFLTESVREFARYEQELANIQGVLSSKSPTDAKAIGFAINESSQKYGAPLLETAQAAKTLAQAGLNAREVMQELDYTMMGMRGLGMTIDQMNELQIAIRAVSGGDVSTSSILERISRIESQYAVSSQDLAESLQISSPFLAHFGQGMRGMQDVMDQTIGMSTVMVEQLRVSGKQTGNALKFMFARLLRPEILEQLQGEFGARLGGTDGGLLPLDEVMKEINSRFQSLQQTDPLKADQMLAVVAGAHRVNYLSALLNNYSKSVDIAAESSYAFGEATQRSFIAMDTMAARTQQARNSFQLFVNNMLDGTMIADGLKASLEGLSLILGGLGGQGGGSLTALAMLVGGFAGVQGFRGAHRRLGIRKDARELNLPYDEVLMSVNNREREQIAARRGLATGGTPAALTRGAYAAGVMGSARFGMARAGQAGGAVMGGLVNFLGPTGVLALGAAGLTMALGGLYRMFKDSTEAADRYQIKIKTAQELRVWEAPQYQRLEELAGQLGIRGRQGEVTAQGAYSRIRDTLLNDPAIQAIVSSYGAKDANELLAMTQDGRLNNEAPEIANRIVDAFSKSTRMGDEFTKKMREMKTEAERVAFATELIGQAAFAANYQLTQAIQQMRDSTNRMIEEVGQGLDNLDISKRKNLFTQSVGELRDSFLFKTNLQTGVSIPEQNLMAMFGINQARRKLNDLFDDSGMADGIKEALMGSNSIFGDAVNQAITNMEKISSGSVNMAQLLAEAARIIDDPNNVSRYSWTEHAIEGNKAITRRITGATAAEAFKVQLGKAMLTMTGYEDVVRAVDPGYSLNARPSAEQRGPDWLQKKMAEAAAWAEGQARAFNAGNQPESMQIRSFDELSKAVEHTVLAVDAGAGAISEFKDKLLDLALSLYTDLRKIDIEEGFAGRQGLAFNGNDARMNLMKSSFVGFMSFQDQLTGDILRTQSQLETLRSMTFKARRRNPDTGMEEEDEYSGAALLSGNVAPEDVQKQFDRQRNELDAKLQLQLKQFEEIKSQAFKLADLFPAGSQREGVLAYLNGQFSQAGEDPISRAQAIKGVSEYLEKQYEILQVDETRKKLRMQTFALQVQEAEGLAEVRRMALDLEDNILVRATLRDQIAWGTVQAKHMELKAQFEIGELSAQDYVLKSKQLQDEFELTSAKERQVDLERTRVDLIKKGRDNLGQSLSGVRGALKDTGSYRNAGSAVQGILGPMGSTIYGRFVDEFMDGAVKRLSNNGVMKTLFESPEAQLQSALERGGMSASGGIERALDMGGNKLVNKLAALFGSAGIISGVASASTGSRAGATIGAITAVGMPTGDGIRRVAAGLAGTQADDRLSREVDTTMKKIKASGGSSTANSTSRDISKQFALQAASMIGNIGGSVLGGGGQWAQTGSSVGSLIGMGLGSFGGPLGMAVGSGLGGLLGGLIGGSRDKETSATVQSLDAIEKAQRDTISAIDRQTSLLSLENRLINLPTGFNIPGYMPQFATSGGGSGGGAVVYEQNQISLDIRIEQDMDPNTARVMIQQAVADGLRDGRSNNGRRVRKY